MPNTYHQRFLSQSERFWSKVDKSIDPNGCWIWKGSHGRYGRFGIGSRKDGTRTCAQAHVMAYQELVGPIPEGAELDHTCRNTLCVNPNHLEPLTHQKNMERGYWGSKTHCPKGHPYDSDTATVWIKKDGTRNRICLICKREAEARRYATNLEQNRQRGRERMQQYRAKKRAIESR